MAWGCLQLPTRPAVVPSCRCPNEKVPKNPLDLSVGYVWSNGRAYYAPWAAIWGAVGARWIAMALKAADQKSESFAKDVLSEQSRIISHWPHERRELRSPGGDRVDKAVTRGDLGHADDREASSLPTDSHLLTYLLTHPSRGDSLWPAFAGTEAGRGLLCRRRSHPSHPTRDPGLSTALLSRSTLEHAITHSATPHLRPTHTRSLSNPSTLLSTRPCRSPAPPTQAPPTSPDLQSPPPRH